MTQVKNILNTIILSLISGIIFWVIFSYLPMRKRKQKIRPKINQDLEYITTTLNHFFYYIFKSNREIEIKYRQQLIDGTLNQEGLHQILLNKCTSLSDLDTFPHKDSMIPIGENIEKLKTRILNRINELYNFLEFLDVPEIIVLEKLKKLLNAREIERKKNRNLTYLTSYFYDIYQLYLDLNEITFSKHLKYIETSEYYDISFPLFQIDYYFYYKKDFKKCKKVVKVSIPKFPNTPIFQFRNLMCEYALGQKKKAFKEFRKMFEEKISEQTSIVSFKSYIKEAQRYDDKILEFVKSKVSNIEYEKLISSMEEDERRVNSIERVFQKECEYLKNYFK